MKNLSPFQIGIYVACVVGVIAAVVLFSRNSSQNSSENLSGSVTIWGTLPQVSLTATTDVLRQTYKDVTINYVEKTPATFQSELVNALASGVGPDLVFLSLGDVIANKDRLLTIPYTSLPEQAFRGTFVDQADAYMNDQGVVAFPFSIDPMVMYYNRDMFTSSFIVKPPETWDEIISANKKITQQDDAGNLQVQTVALGSFDNITRAKEMIALLINQAGNRLVRFDPIQAKYVSTFAESTDNTSPVVNAFSFYTAFANNFDNDRYSWNRTLPNDKNQFLAGRLAVYFGFASELQGIRLRNPNLNFSLAMMPQRSNVPTKSTFGSMYGLGILKMSKNPNLAVTIAQAMVGKDAVGVYLANEVYTAPARRDLLAEMPVDSVRSIIYQSAIISRGFLDPDPVQTTAFFKRYIDQINAGAISPESIVSPGNSLFTTILNSVQK
jgi:ABC-type glycerol-3-phosphate transport system substrate-binding protein